MSRKETPDILGTLMGEALKQESNIEVKQQDNKAIKQANNKTIPKQLLFEEIPDEPVEEAEQIKEKATFNLSLNILTELEDKCHEIRKLAGSKKITKTLIVEEALRMAFAEFDLKKQLGKFYGKLASNKAIK